MAKKEAPAPVDHAQEVALAQKPDLGSLELLRGISNRPMNGFKDIFGSEKRVGEFIKWRISELFQLWGYDIIEVPLIERTASFSEAVVGSSPWPEWDKRGCFYLRINNYGGNYNSAPKVEDAVLIPEGTISVSRWVAAKLLEDGDFPTKVFYVTPCFRNELVDRLSSTKGRQFDQVGLEILGIQSKNADIESMLLIARGLEHIDLKPENIVIRIGDVAIFNKLAEASSLNESERVSVKEFLDKIAETRAGKDYVKEKELRSELSRFLDGKASDVLKSYWLLLSEKDGLRSIPAQYSQPSLAYLDELCSDLKNKFGVNAQLDSSVVRSHEYYTGTVFEVDYHEPDKVNVEIAGGGRYNKLIGRFTKGQIDVIPATGFAYGLQRLLTLWKPSSEAETTKNITFFLAQSHDDTVIRPKEDDYQAAFVEAEKLRAQGVRASIHLGEHGQNA